MKIIKNKIKVEVNARNSAVKWACSRGYSSFETERISEKV
jgi:hypothetical protein